MRGFAGRRKRKRVRGKRDEKAKDESAREEKRKEKTTERRVGAQTSVFLNKTHLVISLSTCLV